MKSSITQLVAGLVFVLVGVLLILDKFGIVGGILSTWWPMAIVALGVAELLSKPRGYLWGIIVVAVGVILQVNNLDIISVNPWEFFWPALVILFGISLISNSGGRTKTGSSGDEHMSAILGGVEQTNTSKDYKGGSVTAVLGGAKIDLRKAVIKKEANLQVFVLAGGVELLVPEGVLIKPQASCILGGIEDGRKNIDTTKDVPVLYITGTVTMGGIEIKS